MKGTVVALSCGAALAASAQFSHTMPAKTGEKPTNPSREEMLRDFKDPFGKVQTGCYWYWMAGNVTCER